MTVREHGLNSARDNLSQRCDHDHDLRIVKRGVATEPCLYVVHHYGRRRKVERYVVREKPARMDGNGSSISFRYQFLVADGHESRILLVGTLTVKPISERPRHVFSMGDTKYPGFLGTQFQRHRASSCPRRPRESSTRELGARRRRPDGGRSLQCGTLVLSCRPRPDDVEIESDIAVIKRSSSTRDGSDVIAAGGPLPTRSRHSSTPCRGAATRASWRGR